MWPPVLINLLSERLCIITFDNRGMGFSTADDREFSVELFARDTIELLDRLKVRSAHIAGWSMGSFIAQEIAIRDPERVRKLILMGASCGGDEALWPDDETWNAVIDLKGTMKERVGRMFSNLFPASWLNKNPDPSLFFPEIRSPVRDDILKRQADTLKSWKGSFPRRDWISSETLIIAGTEDRVIPLKNAYILGEGIKNSRIEEIQGGGHGFFFQFPEKTAQIILDFINSG